MSRSQPLSNPTSQAASSVPSDDSEAIVRLHAAVARQRAAFLNDPYPAAETRRDRLRAIIGMMVRYRSRIVAAMNADFGHHPTAATELSEVLGMVGRAQHAIDRLEDWMQPEERDGDRALLGDAVVELRRQPKGVIGNISPWNFPFDLSVGPLIDILAAGNRAILKPSDYAPACSALLAEMIAETFDPDLVTVALGGVDLARAFAEVRWDHLLYTGSPAIGREIMLAAARNLVPVTLELGGKCPAIIAPGQVDTVTVETILSTKLVKHGQMCISVDHVWAPRAELGRFVQIARSWFAQTLPDYSRSPDCAGLISDRHLNRIQAMIAEARARGCEVIELEVEGETNPVTRQTPLVLVINPPADLQMMREEIFGPILPVLIYDNLADVVDAINAAERPLGLYVFAETDIAETVLRRTVSGGAVINACAIQGALPDLPFGVVGHSGIGRHHGREGFQEFSNARGVVTRGRKDELLVFCPPYARADAMLQQVLPA